MESKIYLFRDRPDYIKKISNDAIINVTESVGSGKSTYGRKFSENPNYVVIGFDSISGDKDPYTMNKEIFELRKVLLKNIMI